MVELLRELQRSHRLTYFFISHDISIVSRLCDTQSLVEAARYFRAGRSDN